MKLSDQQKQAYRVGGILAVVLVAVILWPGSKPLAVPGPHNTGHAQLECQACHASAPGTVRQQLQANVRHWLGLRQEPARFGTIPAGNDQCLDCHDNQTDAHPVYRFNEPRFQAARQAIAPQHCTSCHRQHQGRRVSAAIDVCRHCHEDTTLRDDPVDVSHQQLTAQGQWDTCLGCHDFHGNHAYPAPTQMADRLPDDVVTDYLLGGPSPYGSRVLTVMQTMRVEQ